VARQAGLKFPGQNAATTLSTRAVQLRSIANPTGTTNSVINVREKRPGSNFDQARPCSRPLLITRHLPQAGVVLPKASHGAWRGPPTAFPKPVIQLSGVAVLTEKEKLEARKKEAAVARAARAAGTYNGASGIDYKAAALAEKIKPLVLSNPNGGQISVPYDTAGLDEKSKVHLCNAVKNGHIPAGAVIVSIKAYKYKNENGDTYVDGSGNRQQRPADVGEDSTIITLKINNTRFEYHFHEKGAVWSR
jgi:hypothetical protein